MNARGGLHAHLKSDETSWNEKIKIARYIWKSDHVHLPNKEQVILDWLCLSLAGKRRVPVAEADRVWQCLHEILHTRRCHHTSSHGHALILKPVIYQQLLEELQSHLNGKGVTCSNLDIIISSWHSIVTSSTIGYTFTSKFEQMVQLLSLTVQVALKQQLNNDAPLSNDCEQLIATTATKCISLRPKANAQTAVQNVSSKLLLPIASFLHRCSSAPDTTLSPCGTHLTHLLSDLLFSTLFSKDIFKYYELYLNLVLGFTSGSFQIPKFIESVFSLLKQQLQSQDEVHTMETFLPKFYQSFLDQYRPGENVVSFHLLTYLTKLMGIPSDEGSTALPPAKCMILIQKLLEVASVQNVYKSAVDLSQGGKQLAWLQQLTDWLLSQTDRDAAWFSCLHLLMKLSYSTSEPKLIQILKAAWLDIPQVDDDEDALLAQSDFLCDLVQVYAKLHQISKLIINISDVLQDCAQHVHWSAKVIDRLSYHFTQLPQTMCIDIWKQLINHLMSRCLPEIKEGAATHEADAVCTLMSVFLMNVRVADYSVTHTTAKLVHDLMGRTRTNVLQPLLQHILDKKLDGCVGMLKLMLAWGELHLVLSQYTDYKPADAFPQIVTPLAAHDLSFLHPYISTKVANKLHMMVTGCEDKRLVYMWEQLIIQKIRAILVFGSSAHENGIFKSSIEKTVAALFSLQPEKDDLHCQVSWDGQIDSLKESTFPLASWHLKCHYLALLAPWCSEEQLQQITSYALWVLKNPAPPSRSGFVTLRDVSRRMLDQAEFEECVALQSALVATFLRQSADYLTPQKSPKKQKTGSKLLGRKLLLALAERQEFEELIGDVESLFDAEPNSRFTEKQVLALYNFIKVLEAQPVEYFTPENHTRTFLGVCVVLAHVSTDDISTQQTQLIQACLHLLELLLDSAAASQIYTSVNSGKLSDWLMRQACGFAKQDRVTQRQYQNVLFGLLRLSTKSNDDLCNLAGFIDKVVESLKKAEDSLTTLPAEFSIHLHTGVVILRVFSMMLCRSSLKQQVKDLCSKYFSDISVVVMDIIQALFAQSSDPDMKSGFIGVMIDGVTVMLDFVQKNQEASFNKNILLNLQDASRMTLTMLKNSQTGEYLESMLGFIHTACVTYDTLKDLYPNMYLEKVWSLLLNHLESLEDTTPKHQHSQQKVMPLTSEAVQKEEQMESAGEDVESDAFYRVQPSDTLPSSQRGHSLKHEVEECLACVTGSVDHESFKNFVNRLIANVDIDNFEKRTSSVTVALNTWNRLLTENMDEEKLKIVHFASKNLLLRLNEIDTVIATYESISCDVSDCINTMLRTITTMLSFGQGLLSGQCVPLCLHCCHWIPLDGLHFADFIRLYHGKYQVLNEMLVQQPAIVFNIVPAFLSAASYLLKAIVCRANQDSTSYTDKEVEQLVGCGHLIERLFSLLLTHKVEFARVAPYLVSDYVTEVQKVTLFPQVKKALLSGIYKLLDMCDQHSISLLQMNLSTGLKEIFNTLHKDYTKYHKYTGRV